MLPAQEVDIHVFGIPFVANVLPMTNRVRNATASNPQKFGDRPSPLVVLPMAPKASRDRSHSPRALRARWVAASHRRRGSATLVWGEEARGCDSEEVERKEVDDPPEPSSSAAPEPPSNAAPEPSSNADEVVADERPFVAGTQGGGCALDRANTVAWLPDQQAVGLDKE